MPTLDDSFAAIADALATHYGTSDALGAAAGLEPFPGLVAVMLVCAADPRKAARGLDALAGAGLLDPKELADADPAEIGDVLKSSGITQPARGFAPIQRLALWYAARAREQGRGDLASVATEALREELSRLNGIGPATADALLVLALGRAVYPLDRATYRILVRHSWLDISADYAEARAVVERAVPPEPESLAQLSDWFERIGREFCRVRAAKCERCPLRDFLPEGGPIEPEITS